MSQSKSEWVSDRGFTSKQ